MPSPQRFLASFASKHPKQLLAAGAALCCAIGIGIAAAPPAGSVIGNQASASYTDSTGTPRTSSSNLVQTTVAQVNAYTLTAGATKSVAPGGTVYFPHTITNTGNGSDTYTLNGADAGGGAIATLLCNAGTVAAPLPVGCNVFMYPDADGNGVPDSNVFLTTAAGLTTASIPAGGTYKFVMGVVWPAATTTGTETVTVSATSVGGANGSVAATFVPATHANTDIVNVTQAAVINVTKALSVTTGARSTAACVTPFTASANCMNTTVTLTYTNNGGAAADLTLTDTIGTGATAGFRYVLGSGRWSGCASTPLTDAVGAEAAACGLSTYSVVSNVITAVVPNVAPGVTGTISFDLNVSDTAPIGGSGTANTATTSYGLGPTTGVTNTATYTVAAIAGVVANNKRTGASNVTGTPASPAGAADDNTVLVTTAPQGGTIWFANMIWNTGTVTDAFDITKFSQTFPVGTNITFYSDSNATCPATQPVSGTTAPVSIGSVLLDSGTNGVADTGPMAPGACKVVWTRVDLLPTTATDTAFNLVVRAISVNDATKFDDVTDTLNDIIERAVDLTNGAAVGAGTQVGTGSTFQGAAVSPAVVTTNTGVFPGTSTKFNLTVTNTAGAADNYDLSAWNTYSAVGSAGFTSAFGTGAGATGSAGYSVAFYLGTCAAAGASPMTNTGNVAPAASVNVCAIVTVPANAAAGTKDIYFRVESPASVSYTTPYAGWDVKHDAFTIAATTGVTINPDRTGSAVPGGNAVYGHDVCNSGNSPATVQIEASNSSPGNFNSALWFDVNGDGAILTPPDVNIPLGGGTIQVPAGACVRILDNTFVGAGATIGSTNTTTVKALDYGTSVTPPAIGAVGPAVVGGTLKTTNVSLDTTTVVTGDVGLVKEQREVSCSGAGGAGTPVAGVQGTYTQNALPNKVNPGACLQYRVTAANMGTLPATALSMTDSIPTWTKSDTTACAASASYSGGAAPLMNAIATGATGTYTAGPVAAVNPGQTVVMVFCVKVDQ